MSGKKVKADDAKATCEDLLDEAEWGLDKADECRGKGLNTEGCGHALESIAASLLVIARCLNAAQADSGRIRVSSDI